MIIEQGVIIAVNDTQLTLMCRSRMDCQRCAEGKGCGGGILARWLGDRQFQVQAYFDPQTQTPTTGDLVKIGLPASRLVRLAAIMYGLPLLLMAGLLLLQVQISPAASDLVSVLVAGSGLFLGFKFAGRLVSKANKNGQLLPQLQAVQAIPGSAGQSCQSIKPST